jgi:hypothetical protein
MQGVVFCYPFQAYYKPDDRKKEEVITKNPLEASNATPLSAQLFLVAKIIRLLKKSFVELQ